MRKSQENGDRRATDGLAGPKRAGESLGDMGDGSPSCKISIHPRAQARRRSRRGSVPPSPDPSLPALIGNPAMLGFHAFLRRFQPRSGKMTTHERSQPVLLHLVRGRSPPRRLQAIRIWQGDPAVHRPAAARLRAGEDQGRRAGRAGYPRESRAEPGAVLAAQVGPALLQYVSPRHEEPDGRPGAYQGKPVRLHAGIFAVGARHLRELRFPHADRPAGQVQTALSGDREVRQYRPPPRSRQQRPDGRRVRGTDPQVCRAFQRDRRRALHPAMPSG